MTEQAPAVSVVIPTYTCSGPLQLTLQTVLMQDFADLEVLVVGDGCTYDTEERVQAIEDEVAGLEPGLGLGQRQPARSRPGCLGLRRVGPEAGGGELHPVPARPIHLERQPEDRTTGF